MIQKIMGTLMISFICVSCSTVMEPVPSGFLGDYSTMRPSKIIKGMYVDRASSERLGDYSKFMIDPVEIYLHKDAKAEHVDPKFLQLLADYFRDAVIQNLEKNYEVVSEPGEGVLRIRSAITDVLPNKVVFNIQVSTTVSGIGLGGASMEAEFIDAQTGER